MWFKYQLGNKALAFAESLEPILKGPCPLNPAFTILLLSLTSQFMPLDRMANTSLCVLAKHTEYMVLQVSIAETRHSDVRHTFMVM